MVQEPTWDSDAEQDAAIAAYKASYHEKNRPPLTAAERQQREGNVTIPITPEIRAALAPVPGGNPLVTIALIAIVLFAGAFFGLWKVAGFPWYGAVLGACVPVVWLCGSYAYASYKTRRRNVAVGKLQSYDRFAGSCTITEHCNFG